MTTDYFSRELANGQTVDITVQSNLKYEPEGTVLFCLEVYSDYNKETDIFDTHVETNVYVHADGTIEVRKRGL